MSSICNNCLRFCNDLTTLEHVFGSINELVFTLNYIRRKYLMNKFLIVLLTLLFNIQQAQAFSIDTFMDKKVAPVSDAIAAVIFTR